MGHPVCRSIVYLCLIEILTKIINNTNKETDLEALHPTRHGRIRVPPGGHFFTWITLFNGRVPPEVMGDYCHR
jgi:hypothetical protein